MEGMLRAGQQGQMQQQDHRHNVGTSEYCWPPPNERDAYIGWLKSEFAAANALIDSMCHHLHSMGGPGEYNEVFGCLNRRRHAWTASLYMQSFLSVAEIVSALEDVAWKRHQCHHGASLATKACPTSSCRRVEGVSNLFNSTKDSSVAESHQTSGRPQGLLSSKKDVNAVHVNATAASDIIQTVEVETSALSTNSAESCVTGCVDNETSLSVCKARSDIMAHLRSSGEQGLEVEQLLNTEISIAPREEDARRAIIKRSLQFQCCELADGQQINDGESVELCEGVFNSKEIDEMVGIISRLEAAGRQGELGCAFRGRKDATLVPDIIQFGPEQGNTTHMPKFFQAIIGWLTSCGILPPKKSPDSCRISIFNEGSFEAPNTDQGAWQKPLCVISLMEECVMVFGHSISIDQYGSCKGSFQVTLPVGSVMLLRENFRGILQKAVPAAPSRRITIALGKAVSTSKGEVNWVNTAAGSKMKNKYQAFGGDKRGRLPPDMRALSHQHQHPLVLPHMQFAVPCQVQPNFPPDLMLPSPAVVVPRLLGSSSAGTGVFFPSCDAPAVSVPTSWQSTVLLVSSSSLVASSTSVHSKRAGKHAGTKEASACARDTQALKKKISCQVVT